MSYKDAFSKDNDDENTQEGKEKPVPKESETQPIVSPYIPMPPAGEPGWTNPQPFPTEPPPAGVPPKQSPVPPSPLPKEGVDPLRYLPYGQLTKPEYDKSRVQGQ